MPRLNLSVPAQMDEVLEALSSATGRTKASYVVDAMSRAFPFWRRDLAALDTLAARPVPASAPVNASHPDPALRVSGPSLLAVSEASGHDGAGRPVRLPTEQKGQFRERLKRWQEQQKHAV